MSSCIQKNALDPIAVGEGRDKAQPINTSEELAR